MALSLPRCEKCVKSVHFALGGIGGSVGIGCGIPLSECLKRALPHSAFAGAESALEAVVGQKRFVEISVTHTLFFLGV